MRRRLRRAALGLGLAAAVLAGCDQGPQGPGTVTLTVEASVPLGAALLELRGGTVDGAEAVGSGWAVLRPVADAGTGVVQRLVLVQREAGTLSAELHVTDRGVGSPSVTVLEVSDVNDLPLPDLGGARARIR